MVCTVPTKYQSLEFSAFPEARSGMISRFSVSSYSYHDHQTVIKCTILVEPNMYVHALYAHISCGRSSSSFVLQFRRRSCIRIKSDSLPIQIGIVFQFDSSEAEEDIIDAAAFFLRANYNRRPFILKSLTSDGVQMAFIGRPLTPGLSREGCFPRTPSRRTFSMHLPRGQSRR